MLLTVLHCAVSTFKESYLFARSHVNNSFNYFY